MNFLSTGMKKSGVCREVAISRGSTVHLCMFAHAIRREWSLKQLLSACQLGLLQFPLVYKLFDCERICHFTRSFSGPSFMHPISVAPTTGLLSFMHIFTLCILRSNFWSTGALIPQLSETKIFNSHLIISGSLPSGFLRAFFKKDKFLHFNI